MQTASLLMPGNDSPDGQSASRRLQSMLSQAAVGIAIADADLRVIDANERACAMLGYSLDELRHKGFAELTHPDDLERTREQVQRLQSGAANSYQLEKRYIRKDGSQVWSGVTVTAIRNEAGAIDRFLGVLQDIGDRRHVEEVRSRLAAVVDSSDDAIISMTLDGIITTWNPAAARMYGYTAEEAMGSPVTMLIPADHPDEETQILQRLRQGERIDHYQTVRRRKDGTLLDISLTVSPVHDGSGRIVGASKIARDITRHKRNEEALRENTRVLEMLVAAGQAIASELDLQALMQRVTDVGRQMSGAQFGAFFHNVTDAAGGAYMLYALSGAPREAFEPLGLPRNTPVFHATFSGERIVRSADITRDPAYGQVAPHFGMPRGHLPVRSYLAVPVIDRSGKVLGGLFFGHSRPGVFTEHAEKVLAGLASQAAVAMDNARLYEAAQREIASREEAESRLREADRRKDEFLATLAHELRNPLAPIRQAAAIAGASSSSEEQKRWGLGVIERQVRHMSALLNDLLDIARITRGVFEVRQVPTTVGEVIDAALETAGPAIQARNHALRVEVPGRSAALVGDPLRLSQVLANLLLNAAKYTNPRGAITLRATARDHEVEFSVSDTGIGIAAEAMHELFEMFSQVSSHRERSEGGLGIGLALARGLVRLHGGSIEARSEGPGRGAEFIVKIPRRLPQDRAADPPVTSPERPPAVRTVLIADDNEDAARTLAMLLEVSGHRVVVAHDGEQALRRVEESRPEFVLLDIGMPRLDGYEVARRLRASGGEYRPTLVAVTGWGQESDRARAMAAGFDQHFTKPIDPDRVLDLLAHSR